MRKTVRTLALERSGELLGGERALAQYLKVSRTGLRSWMSGSVDLPHDLFLKLVDVLLDQDFAELQRDIARAAASKTVDGEDASRKT